MSERNDRSLNFVRLSLLTGAGVLGAQVCGAAEPGIPVNIVNPAVTVTTAAGGSVQSKVSNPSDIATSENIGPHVVIALIPGASGNSIVYTVPANQYLVVQNLSWNCSASGPAPNQIGLSVTGASSNPPDAWINPTGYLSGGQVVHLYFDQGTQISEFVTGNNCLLRVDGMLVPYSTPVSTGS
jgi:hypothetical protein